MYVVPLEKTQNCCSSAHKHASNAARGALTALHRGTPARVSVAQYSVIAKLLEHRRS